MESRFQHILLGLLFSISLTAQAAEQAPIRENDDLTVLDEVVEPGIERRRIKEDQIDVENFEIGFYAGVMSVEDFGSNDSYGVRLAYHISEDWFLEGAYGQSTVSETSFEQLTGSNLLSDENRDLEYYNISLGVNLFPGEIFLGKNHSFNTSFYLIAGVGSTEFANDKFFTYNFGGGFRMLITDWIAFHMDARNHLFTHNIFGDDKSIQNLEHHVGLSFYF
ncbi:outer membrane beta-barrel domain-containing protein [Teredinibacter sp. KSP-S5-2]|uniref:outer membrane beta-barrel domain-containing protein n=1 Tax=Teredinibacter sp. KSP-S5-2 TaxID=3034506 RepID=UPI0029351941|nr:outer membrane beta-barrel domain-containing protein [Teredinibacter sp. KSP-S5-2]WNO08955.1 outer membrane beta-barrel domain-containing protein [Teredinibacter sp. KSP-S5-2]